MTTSLRLQTCWGCASMARDSRPADLGDTVELVVMNSLGPGLPSAMVSRQL
jgi:hypothetical protein